MKWACVPEGAVRCGHAHACLANETTGSLTRCELPNPSSGAAPKCHFEKTSMPAHEAQDATRIRSKSLAVQASPNSQICEDVAPYLPSECECSDVDMGFHASCSVNFLEVDTITVEADVIPCSSPAHADLVVSDSELGIRHEFAGISAGEQYQLAVPGLSLDVPLVGTVGVVMDVTLNGDISEFDVELAVDACAGVGSEKECGADLTSYLPISLLSHEFDFSNLC